MKYIEVERQPMSVRSWDETCDFTVIDRGGPIHMAEAPITAVAAVYESPTLSKVGTLEKLTGGQAFAEGQDGVFFFHFPLGS